jgi:hypothetical protein
MLQARGDDVLVVEDRGWPLFVVRLPPAVSVETVRSMVDAFEGAYDRGERFAAIVDSTLIVKFPSAGARRVLTDWVASPHRAERERTFTVAVAVVLLSGPLRALSAAINLARPPASPQRWAATMAEAVEWTTQRLIDSGIPLTAGARALHAEVTAAHTRRGERAAR